MIDHGGVHRASAALRIARPSLLRSVSRLRGKGFSERGPRDVPDVAPHSACYPVGRDAGLAAAARAHAPWLPAGELTPPGLAFRIHQHFGHELPLAERLASASVPARRPSEIRSASGIRPAAARVCSEP